MTLHELDPGQVNGLLPYGPLSADEQPIRDALFHPVSWQSGPHPAITEAFAAGRDYARWRDRPGRSGLRS